MGRLGDWDVLVDTRLKPVLNKKTRVTLTVAKPVGGVRGSRYVDSTFQNWSSHSVAISGVGVSLTVIQLRESVVITRLDRHFRPEPRYCGESLELCRA